MEITPFSVIKFLDLSHFAEKLNFYFQCHFSCLHFPLGITELNLCFLEYKKQCRWIRLRMTLTVNQVTKPYSLSIVSSVFFFILFVCFVLMPGRILKTVHKGNCHDIFMLIIWPSPWTKVIYHAWSPWPQYEELLCQVILWNSFSFQPFTKQTKKYYPFFFFSLLVWPWSLTEIWNS